MIIERTKAGLKAAKERRKIGGRKRRMTQNTSDSIKEFLESETPPKGVHLSLGILIPTLYLCIDARFRPEITFLITEN